MSLKIEQSMIECQWGSWQKDSPGLRRHWPAQHWTDYPLADLSRECIVLSLRAVAAKHREGGCWRKGPPHLSSPPQATSGPTNLLVFKRSDTLGPHRCHLSLEAARQQSRDLYWMPHPLLSLPGFIGYNPSPSTTASAMAICHVMGIGRDRW